MKINKIKEMSSPELEKELVELKNELFKLRFSLATNGLDNPIKIKEVKKDIDDVKISMATQIADGFTKLSEAVKEEEKEVEEIKLTKKQNEISLDELSPLERFRATKFKNK